MESQGLVVPRVPGEQGRARKLRSEKMVSSSFTHAILKKNLM